MPDKPTGRVVALIVLLIVVAAALRGYLPAREGAAHTESGPNRVAFVFVVAALSVTLALVAFAVIARLRDPRAIAPYNRDLSEMLGTGRGRPNWRVVLIGLAVIVAWLLIATLVSRALPHGVAPPPQTPAPSAPPTAQVNPQPPPPQRPQHDNGDMYGILLATTVPMLLIIVAGSAVMSRRRWRASKPGTVSDDHTDDYVEPASAPKPSESLVRAAELGLAEIGDLNREPREAIIACYAAMESELANFPGAAPQDFDTPTEVLGRAVEHHALHADNAVQLVNLFEEARFSPHVMNEGHRDIAVQVLRLVLAELRSPA
ncbi:DUF4129 domain-containing protein [Mycobacterium sp. IS-836]|uniref:DUF4129 domain-containing protein n=1 Tax=Mycobacterium sp. IS-836 TaxID=1834160 RepID=UPI001E3223D6|nr:DUF4129 domain-containing protein [Mycobacterium sp. IS-836]